MSNVNLGVEIRCLWGEALMEEVVLREGGRTRFRIGSAPGVDFVMSSSRLGTTDFTLVSLVDGEPRLVLSPGMRLTVGERSADGEVVVSREVLRVEAGPIAFEVRLKPLLKAPVVPWVDRVDYLALNTLMVVGFVAALIAISADVREPSDDDDALDRYVPTIAKVHVVAAPKPPPERIKEPTAEKTHAPVVASQTRVATARHEPTTRRAGGLAGAIFEGGGISGLLSPNGLGAAIAGLQGASRGSMAGLGGIDLRGDGNGGDVGPTERIGALRAPGDGRRYGDLTLTKGKAPDIDPGAGPVDLICGTKEKQCLDPNLIREVIRRHRGQLRYCYELALSRAPKLAGRVNMRFGITALGTVLNAHVVESSANNVELETCIASRVSLWTFPMPTGGATAVVSYPFVFKPSGD